MVKTATAINSFAPVAQQADVSPVKEHIFVLSSSHLKEIIDESVQKALESPEKLSGIVQDLQDQIMALSAKLVALQKTIDIQEKSIDGQAKCIIKLFDMIEALQGQQSRSDPTKKSLDHVEELYRLMTEDKTQQISIAKGARLLGVSKERMRQLKPLILADGRFEMGWSNIRGQKGTVIKLRQYLK